MLGTVGKETMSTVASTCSLGPFGNGTEQHEARVQFLDSLAILLGCREPLFGVLPGGLVPDVLRRNPSTEMLFVGEAKHTESPGCTATQVRLTAYMRCLAYHVAHRGGPGTFAICFGNERHGPMWLGLLRWLGDETGVLFAHSGMERFDVGLQLAWVSSICIGHCAGKASAPLVPR